MCACLTSLQSLNGAVQTHENKNIRVAFRVETDGQGKKSNISRDMPSMQSTNRLHQTLHSFQPLYGRFLKRNFRLALKIGKKLLECHGALGMRNSPGLGLVGI